MGDRRVGVIACSGEECLGGTLSRLATRKVMNELRSGKVVTLCLPLYIAGGEEERYFARKFPVVTVEGCDKCCGKKATIKFSDQEPDTVVVSQLLGEDVALSKIVSGRDLTEEHYQMVDQVAEDICKKVDKILAEK